MAKTSLALGVVVLLCAGGSWLYLKRARTAVPVAPSPEAGAVQIEDPLPFANIYSSEEISRSFNNARFTPLGDAQYRFTMLVPKEWEERRVILRPEQLRKDNETPLLLAELAPRDSDDVLLEVRYIRVPLHVTLDRFLQVYAEKSGFQIVKRQRGDFNGRKVEDALLRVRSPVLGPTLTRLTVSRKGEIIFLVAGSAREASFEKWKRVFAAAAVSFDTSG